MNFPKKFVKIVSVPMSDYQLGKYKEVRNQKLLLRITKNAMFVKMTNLVLEYIATSLFFCF